MCDPTLPCSAVNVSHPWAGAEDMTQCTHAYLSVNCDCVGLVATTKLLFLSQLRVVVMTPLSFPVNMLCVGLHVCFMCVDRGVCAGVGVYTGRHACGSLTLLRK